MVAVILQARMSSSRLPGKVLKPILGSPMISHQIARINESKKISELVVATSDEKSDDELARYIENLGERTFRGSLNNVYKRFYDAIEKTDSRVIVRLTADCPLLDPDVLDQVIDFYFSNNFDYASNTLKRTFPKGLDVEVFDREAFKAISSKIQMTQYDLEHVTPGFYRNPDQFKIGNLENKSNSSMHRWTVDTQEDFDFVNRIYTELFPKNHLFKTSDILEYLHSNPEEAHFETDQI